MLSFRKKIFLTEIVLVAILIAILFPVAGLIVDHIMRTSLVDRARVRIADLEKAPDEAAMIEIMKSRSEFIFVPVSLLDDKGKVIFHSFLPNSPESELMFDQESETEVQEALKYGVGFNEHQSPFFSGKFYYIAVAFTAHNKKYVLHMNYRAEEIDKLVIDFKIGILVFTILILIISSTLHTIIIQFIMRPVQQIIDAIRPYKEGKEELLPRIILNESMQAGEFSKLATTFNSLTDRIQQQIEYLTRQREETEEILESSGEGIIAADPSARVTFANRTACRMLGVTSDQVIGQTLDGLKASAGGLAKKCHDLIVHALQTSEPAVHTWIVREKAPLYLDLISAPLAHRDGALLVFQDKTSDYRIVELGKDFVANASHELRTPITIIRGFAETLQDLPNISQEMLQDIIEKIVRTCIRLDKLVRSLLTLADIENLSEDRFRPVNLIPLVENCVHNLLTVNPSVQVSVRCDVEAVPIIADPDLFELAIMNILENAVKYSQEPARIEISMEIVNQEVYLRMKDHGIGMSEKDLPHVFERFYTVDKARSRKSGGTGLGLSIVKIILEKHKGKIIATSELGQGSTFTFVLPKSTK
jgi:two-component system phosphate regulon sensor histidine kinase PhoR